MATGLQVIGKQATLDTYEAYNLETWAIVQDSNIIVAGKGSDDLSEWLDRFAPAGSVGQYTLRLYDEFEPKEVMRNTEYRYCFKFKLHSDYNTVGGGFVNNQVMQRIEGLEKRLEEPDSESDDLNSIIMGWLDKPEKLATVIGAVKHLINGGPAPVLATVGSMKPPAITEATTTLMDNEATLDRLSKVLDRLEKKDKDILLHLEKLADVADKKPDTFNFLINNLNGL